MGYPLHLTDVARNGLKCNAKEADQIVSDFMLFDVTFLLFVLIRIYKCIMEFLCENLATIGISEN